MKALNGYKSAKAITGDRDRLPAGGYVCRVIKVEDFPEKEYLKIYYDILEGDYAKYWEGVYERNGKEWWPGSFIRSYKESAMGFFKGFIEAIDDSNNCNLNVAVEDGLDERALVKKKIGLVIAYEEYRGKDGSVKERSYVARNTTVQNIEDGKYTVPELKRLKEDTFADLDATDSDLPF